MKKKSESAISIFDKDFDKVLSNGLTRRQMMEKVVGGDHPRLQGDEKWQVLSRKISRK